MSVPPLAHDPYTRGSVTADYQPPCVASAGLFTLLHTWPEPAGEPAPAHGHHAPGADPEDGQEAPKRAFLAGTAEQLRCGGLQTTLGETLC